jgi:hypothetical protein
MKLIQELTALNEAGKAKMPTNDSEFDEMMDAFIGYAIDQDMHETAREDGPESGAEYLMDKFEDWLGVQGFKLAEIEKFMDAREDDVFDYIYNGLT